MKLSVMTYSLAQQGSRCPVEKYVPAIAAAGVQGINWVMTYGRDPAALRRQSLDAGLEVCCYTFALQSLITGVGEYLEEARHEFAAASILEVPRVMVVPMPIHGVVGRTANQERWFEVLAQIQLMASERNIILTIENFQGEGSPFVTAGDLLAARAAVPALRFTFDAGNAATGENPLDTIRALGNLIEYVHFKDWKIYDSPRPGALHGRDGRYYVPALIGDGDVPLDQCITALYDIGYDGYIDIEYEGRDIPAEQAIRIAARRLARKEAALAAESC